MSATPRVIHFVTGGGSGATKVALEIACGHLRTGNFEPLLILRRKRASLPASMQAQIAASGIRTVWVDSGFKYITRQQLAAAIAAFQPQVFVAHGNSEHLWGRQAAFRAKIPVVIHVEHNCERYSFWRRWQTRQLARATSATVCVSHGVADHLRTHRLASERLEIIHNGVDPAFFVKEMPSFAARNPDIVMAARFARQKDHPTLIRAAHRLVQSGWSGRLLLAGGGNQRHRTACEKLVQKLGIAERVNFLGQVSDITSLYHRCRVAVLSTHYEGMPLSLVEYMAAGCAAVASDIPGVTDVIQSGKNGWLFPVGDDAALAQILQTALAGGSHVEAVAKQGTQDAATRFARDKMIARYETLFTELLNAGAR
ncbi:glycosyltransferase [Oleiharenicola lentus]|uniref:glycosyltransferase n=1 Tax=Oleiharenicola lentus TaxID=2508720 RepID=UPI003F66B340